MENLLLVRFGSKSLCHCVNFYEASFSFLHHAAKAVWIFIEGAFEQAIGGVMIGEGASETWAQQPVVSACEEERGADAYRCDPISEAHGFSLDNAVKPQAVELIGQSALGDIVGIFAGQSGEVLAQIGGAEAVGVEAEENDRLPDELGARIGEA